MAAVTAPAAKLIVVNVVLCVIATGSFVLRMISTKIRKRKWQAHDILCFISYLCLIGYAADLIIGAVHGGLGLHITRLPLEKIITSLKVFFASEFLWSTGVCSFRLAILLLYIQIFQIPAFFRAAAATAGLVSIYYVACILTICLSCRPIGYNWDRTIEGTCDNTEAVEIFSAAFNMVVDVWVVSLPLPIVWRLQMARQKKIGISATFALGLAIAAINLGRLIQTVQCDAADFTYCLLTSSMICVAEMSTGVVVACVPTFGPVFFPHRFGPNVKAVYQPKGSRGTPLHQSSSRKPLRGQELEDSGERSFSTHERDDVELKAGLKIGSGYQAHAESTGVFESSDHDVDANGINVRKDLDVHESPRS